jgi:hypothetical protein
VCISIQLAIGLHCVCSGRASWRLSRAGSALRSWAEERGFVRHGLGQRKQVLNAPAVLYIAKLQLLIFRLEAHNHLALVAQVHATVANRALKLPDLHDTNRHKTASTFTTAMVARQTQQGESCDLAVAASPAPSVQISGTLATYFVISRSNLPSQPVDFFVRHLQHDPNAEKTTDRKPCG